MLSAQKENRKNQVPRKQTEFSIPILNIYKQSTGQANTYSGQNGIKVCNCHNAVEKNRSIKMQLALITQRNFVEELIMF